MIARHHAVLECSVRTTLISAALFFFITNLNKSLRSSPLPRVLSGVLSYTVTLSSGFDCG